MSGFSLRRKKKIAESDTIERKKEEKHGQNNTEKMEDEKLKLKMPVQPETSVESAIFKLTINGGKKIGRWLRLAGHWQSR